MFTHFPLELTVYRTELSGAAKAPEGTRWIAIARLGEEALPSLMRKVVAHGLGEEALPSLMRKVMAHGLGVE